LGEAEFAGNLAGFAEESAEFAAEAAGFAAGMAEAQRSEGQREWKADEGRLTSLHGFSFPEVIKKAASMAAFFFLTPYYQNTKVWE
jgi:hypothetical protein